MAKDNVTWQPKWVPLSILDFARIVHNFGEDSEALAKWTRQFADDLLFCNTETEDALTKEMLDTANERYFKLSKAGKKGGRPPKSKLAANNLPHPSDTISTDGPDNRPDQGRDNTANASPSCGPEEGKNFGARQSQNADGYADFREKSDEHARSATGQPVTTCGVLLESGTSPSATDINDQETEAQVSTSEARESRTGAGAPPVRNVCHNAPAPYGRRIKPPKNSAEVMAFAADHEIDEVDARDWYELNFVIRPGCDKDGCVIENWPGHLIAYCRTVKEKRESA
mgnify:CR=1 FL=1